MLKVLDSAVPVACWSCAIGHNDDTLFCPHCSKIQPPPGGDYYSVFGLEPCLNLDMDALEREYHRLSRRLHPDHFARALENEKQWSLADTALLNDAYRTLKDPLRRTEYLLKLEGAEKSADRESQERKSPRAPADLLEEVFDLNMQIEEMRQNRTPGGANPELQKSLTEVKTKFEGLLGAVDTDLRTEWKVWDKGGEAERQAAQKRMAALLDRRRYLSHLVCEVNDTLGN